MTRILALPLLLFASTAASAGNIACMETAVSDPEVLDCASQELDKVEETLADSVKLVLTRLDQSVSDGDKGAEDARDSFIESQEKWIAFRESACNVIFFLNVDGSSRLPETILCMAGYSRERSLKILQIIGH